MAQEKELRMIKAFNATPATLAAFEEQRRALQLRLGVRVGASDFFAWMVRNQRGVSERFNCMRTSCDYTVEKDGDGQVIRCNVCGEVKPL